VALDWFPQIFEAKFVLIVNDSNVGPFTSLQPTISAFENSKADAWALTGSNQHGFHLQSFFLGFHGILRDRALRDFWHNVRHFEDKWKVIIHYELGLSRLLVEEGYVIDVMYPHTAFENARTANVAANLWLDLLVEGYPFVKREIVQKPWIESSANLIPDVINYFFEEDVRSWL
jgi:lipopolysaccharide biosynthesis protein